MTTPVGSSLHRQAIGGGSDSIVTDIVRSFLVLREVGARTAYDIFLDSRFHTLMQGFRMHPVTAVAVGVDG